MKTIDELLSAQPVRLVYLLIFAIPLLFALSAAQRTIGIAVYGVSGFLLLSFAVLVGARKADLSQIRRTLTAGPNPAICAFGLSALVSALVSVNPFYSNLALFQLLAGVLVYATVVYRFQRPNQMRALLCGLVVLGIMVVAAALALDRNLRSLQLAGSFHDRQLLGAFLCLLLPLLCGLASGTKQRAWKIASQLSAILVATGLLLTGCRSSWLGAAVGLLVFGGLALRYVWKDRQWMAQKHVLVGTPLLAVVAVGILAWNSGLLPSIRSRAASLSVARADASVVDRLQLWSIAGQAIAARPGAGWGIGAYPFAQARFNPNSRPASEIVRTGPSLSENPHNTYLLIAAEQGAPGLLAYLALLACFFVYAFRALPRMQTGMRQFILFGAMAAVAGQSVDAFSNPGATFPEISLFFWLILGIGMRAAGLENEAGEPARSNARHHTPQPYSPFRIVVAGASLAALAVHLVGVNLLAAAAASAPGTVAGAGPPGRPNYGGPPPPGGGEGGDGAPAWIAAPLAVGAILASRPDCIERYPPLPEGEDQIVEARVAAHHDWWGPDTTRCVYMEVLSARDNKWYSVTHREETSFSVPVGQEVVNKVRGHKHRYKMTKNLPANWVGRVVVIRGEFKRLNQPPLIAELALPVRPNNVKPVEGTGGQSHEKPADQKTDGEQQAKRAEACCG